MSGDFEFGLFPRMRGTFSTILGEKSFLGFFQSCFGVVYKVFKHRFWVTPPPSYNWGWVAPIPPPIKCIRLIGGRGGTQPQPDEIWKI